ncbi:glycosyltransferase [Enterovibrio norvegicus]|uniref:glycosyltransferase n=1 Tax=Enterovibrio norvegicus TaxID=188144 RepID=UPI000C855CAE|nr:glycosyltransferase [Enterovibrio norvegicus]PMH62420.1 hypothetical protein BCU62_19685 [Enterovibrio norvegicus]
MNFSVLMSLYIKERPEYLIQCLDSLLNQTVKPDEVVIVEDGPLTSELLDVLDGWQDKIPLKRIRINKNVGLGKALNEGLKHCKFSLVARMDTDDICLPNRFERQLYVFKSENIDICGSWVSEFSENIDIITAFKKAPIQHDDIVKFSRLRNPMNHPSVMYRKSVVIEVGGYDDVLYFEDYHLWLKLIDSKSRFYNIDEPLVSMRANPSQLSRRGGFKYGCHELYFLNSCARNGIMPKAIAFRNAMIRFPSRLIPQSALKMLYKNVLRRN